MTSVLLRDTRRGEGQMKTQVGTGVMWPQAQDTWGHQKSPGKGRPPEAAEEERHSQQFDFGL